MITTKVKKKKTTKKETDNDRKELPFLCYDIVTKAVFMEETNILAKMISDITGIEYKLLKDNITLIANEIPISIKNEKAKRCDFVVKVNDGNIISLEVNSSYYPGMENKNLSYLFSEYASLIKRSERYSEKMYALQINLNCYKEKIKKPLAKYVLQEVDDYQVYTKSLSIYNDSVKFY